MKRASTDARHSIHVGQLLVLPLYLLNKRAFQTCMTATKESAALLIISIMHWWAPSAVRVVTDASIRDEIGVSDGKLSCNFAKRAVIIANHQTFTDWVYLWFMAYTESLHAWLYIMLKRDLLWIPGIGLGLRLFGFIFVDRSWTTDESRLRRTMAKLNERKDDPMWLLVFPEGTNINARAKALSAKFAAKTGQPDTRHTLLPRATGLLLCLRSLEPTVEWMYDCTIAYQGILEGEYATTTYTFRGTFFQGKQPRSVGLHWRRFRIADIPLEDEEDFAKWVVARWREKDELIEAYLKTGRFPCEGGAMPEVPVATHSPLEYLRIFLPLFAAVCVVGIVWMSYYWLSRIIR